MVGHDTPILEQKQGGVAMKFPNLPVTSLEDATHDFEQLQTKDILNLTAEGVLQLAVAGTTRRVSFGSQLLNFPTAQAATNTNVTHHLGVNPAAVVVTLAQSPGTMMVTPFVPAFDSSVFTMGAEASTAVTGDVLFYWAAFG
jgi:hypothetical protein